MILGNLTGIIGAALACWYFKLDLWKGILLGSVLVVTPLIFEEIWIYTHGAGIAAGVISFAAVASFFKLTLKQATLVFASAFLF